jgi:hypothetical protein
MRNQELRERLGEMYLAFILLTPLLLGTVKAQDKPQIGIIPQAPHGLRVTTPGVFSDNLYLLSGSKDSTVRPWEDWRWLR